VRVGVLGAPRPVPSRAIPFLGGALVIALALPIFLLAGWKLTGWGLGALIWVGVQLFGLLLARLRPSPDNLAASGVLAFGMMFRVLLVLVVLVAAASSHPRLALAAGLVYGISYTVELGLSLVGYYGQEARA
jgi:hypothetical protein